MTAQTQKRLTQVVVSEDWGRFDDRGFHLYDSPREGEEHPSFVLCTVDQHPVAVFVGQSLIGDERGRAAATMPDWIHAIATANVVDPSDAHIDADLVSTGGVDRPSCAFAVVVGAINDGAFKVEPERFRLRFADGETAEVQLEFDWDTESWSGTVAMNPGR
jgi:hypothetical protein